MSEYEHPTMKPVIVANWKMQLSVESSTDLARSLVPVVAGRGDLFSLVVCPSFVSIPSVAAVVQHTEIGLAAQDVSSLNRGARTGEVSVVDLQTLGCSHCLIGHSERRTYHGETNDNVHDKVVACVRAGLTPIVCVGETGSERNQGKSHAVVMSQITTALTKVPLGPSTQVFIAYEPIWAIGTGVPAEPDQIESQFVTIRNELDEIGVPRSMVKVLYGGSVSSSSVGRFLHSTSAEGFLIGGESQEEKRFIALLETF